MKDGHRTIGGLRDRQRNGAEHGRLEPAAPAGSNHDEVGGATCIDQGGCRRLVGQNTAYSDAGSLAALVDGQIDDTACFRSGDVTFPGVHDKQIGAMQVGLDARPI